MHTGLFWIRPNERTIALMDRITDKLNKEKAWDQVGKIDWLMSVTVLCPVLPHQLIASSFGLCPVVCAVVEWTAGAAQAVLDPGSLCIVFHAVCYQHSDRCPTALQACGEAVFAQTVHLQ